MESLGMLLGGTILGFFLGTGAGMDQAKLQELEAQLKSAQAEVMELREQVVAKGQENALLKAEVKGLRSDYDGLWKEKEALEKENELLKQSQRVDRLEKDVLSSELKKMDAWQKEMLDSQNQMLDALKARDKKIGVLQADVQMFGQRSLEMAKKLLDVQARERKLAAKLYRAQKALEGAEKEKTDLTTKLEAAHAKLASTEGALQNALSQVQSQSKEINKLKPLTLLLLIVAILLLGVTTWLALRARTRASAP